jgi:hypothetical protein
MAGATRLFCRRVFWSCATRVAVSLPPWLLTTGSGFDRAIHYPEVCIQIAQYLATTGSRYRKSIDDSIACFSKLVSLGVDGARQQ